MNYSYHIIHNFPSGQPRWKKLLANLIFWVGVTPIHFRKNQLTEAEHKKVQGLLKKGDLILVGSLRRMGHLFIHGPLTHSAMYVGAGRCIHSHADGVEEVLLSSIFKEYDTMMVLRAQRLSPATLNKVVRAARSQLGQPYDFEFQTPRHPRAFYCTELLVWAFQKAGVDLHLKARSHPRCLKCVIHPMDFIKPNFKRVFESSIIAKSL